ncbi:glucanotransferase domain of glycogen debranching enzyme-domain-containing protein [Cladochytrium replicatum]|nr:glucanotransferase domain of glycogen debranching enzyme-domain-containing protein [Cladochytrium replicatum]
MQFIDGKPFHFRLILDSGSIATKDAVLKTNSPDPGHKVKRTVFRTVHFKMISIRADIFDTSGVFEYHVELFRFYHERTCAAEGGSFIVEPRLYVPYTHLPSPHPGSKTPQRRKSIGGIGVVSSTQCFNRLRRRRRTNQRIRRTVLLPLDGITILTVIPKWMPTIDSWDLFSSFSSSGYNMVHFAPINTQGILEDDLTCALDMFRNEILPAVRLWEFYVLNVKDMTSELESIGTQTVVAETYVRREVISWGDCVKLRYGDKPSKAYVRREVISWGDCVKLRHGDKPGVNPWLWEQMAENTRKMARLFHGLRIDNAELFTGSEENDILFISKLGVNSLISRHECVGFFELSRLVHRHGGRPVESIPLGTLGHRIHRPHASANGTLHSKASPDLCIEVKGSAPHALFVDCTHDNGTTYQKRTAENTLPQATLIAPSLLNVVNETRKYRIPDRSTLNFANEAGSRWLH